MGFHSILFERPDDRKRAETSEAPIFFVDLNLDQIVDAIAVGRDEYNLKPFLYTTLNTVDAIKYRHEVMRDLESVALLTHINSFAQKMRSMREHIAQQVKLHHKCEKEGWFLDAVAIYCDAVTCLAHDLARAELNSRGFLAFCEHVTSYVGSDRFTSLLAETKKVRADLSTVSYRVLVKDGGFTVRKHQSEPDYSADVEQAFEKFKQGTMKDYRVRFFTSPTMNHIEAKVLEFVAQLYPEEFSNLESYCARNQNYLDDAICVFDREIQFYIAYLEYVATFRRVGLKFCYPKISNKDKEVYDYEGFDLALARKLMAENGSVVCNDFYLRGEERIFVVTGPNQGGKTTFARTFGQLHYFASIGCLVPGREAQLFLFDTLFTHFDREEDITTLRGKLECDLIRIHDVLNRATSDSVVIMNEIFASTTLQDAIVLSKKIMAKLLDLDLLCVCVTFIDELSYLSEKTVSVASMVVPENPTVRTFKIVRRPVDGLAYAAAISQKYGLTYVHLRERITP